MRNAARNTGKDIRALIRRRGLTTEQLATGVDLSVGTVYNVISGNSKSRVARQKITNFLGEEIWPAMQPQKTTPGVIAEDTVFQSLTEQEADSLCEKFPESTEKKHSDGVHGPFMVVFTKDTPAVINFSLKNPRALPSPVRAKTK